MMTTYDSEAMRRTRTILADNRSRLQNSIDDLDSRAAHTGESWRGPAGDTFRDELASWRMQTSQVVAELDEFVANLTTAHVQLDQVDQGAARSMSRLRRRLAGS